MGTMSELKLGTDAAFTWDCKITLELRTAQDATKTTQTIASLRGLTTDRNFLWFPVIPAAMCLRGSQGEQASPVKPNQWLNINSSLVKSDHDISIKAARRASSTPAIFCCSAAESAPTSSERSRSVGYRLSEAI